MKNKWIIQGENSLLFALILYVYFSYDFSWILFFTCLLLPDVSMLGYAINSKVGALSYNIGHTLIMPMLILTLYIFFQSEYLFIVGLIWFAHIFMDRTLGYGLKYETSFKETHLQKI